MIRESRQRPEDFVVERLLQPYVAALAFLLLEEGLQYEGHSQNVLAELNRNGQLTGRLVLRDLADTSVNLSFRVAKNKALPTFARGFLPADTPFPIAANAADIHANAGRWRICRGFDTVERYGLWSFVWAINTSLGRYFSRYDRKAVEQRYLELWQSEVIQHLNLRPLFRKNPPGLATDEAIAYFLRQTDWRALGAVRAKRLPEKAEALMIEKRMRRKQNASYDRLECAWGDLFIADGLPGFFRPAF